MTADANTRIILAARPEGPATPEHFRLETTPVPQPGDGGILCRTLYLSLDPYMRGRMNAGKSYANPVEVGEVMVGGTVGEVVTSNNPGFKAGDIVSGNGGWQEYWISDGTGLRPLDPEFAPVSTALGVLGMPGLTAYTGLLNIGRPQAGETVVVAAALGPVGSAVGQIARIKDCRAVGIAGGPDKCHCVVEELGFDACIDHRAADFPEQLKDACPKGIDVYFENVGGPVFDAVLPLLNPFARIPLCGLVSMYRMTGLPQGPDRTPLLMRDAIVKRLTLRGFIVSDYAGQAGDFQRDMGGWLKQGKVRYREDIVDGLGNAPEAFIGMLEGKNFGKLLIRP